MSEIWNLLRSAASTAIEVTRGGTLKGPIFEDVSELTSSSKGAVINESRCFCVQSIDAEKCTRIISKWLYLVSKGEEFTYEERRAVFYSATRLFESNCDHLKRMLHLFIRNLALDRSDSFVITSTLTKYAADASEYVRANAIRTLTRIHELQSKDQLEKYIKTGLVSNNTWVVSTSLLAGLYLMKACPEMVRRWSSEVSECISRKDTTDSMVQFHALALLYELKKSDRLALHRVIASLCQRAYTTEYAECLLIRYAVRLLAHPGDSPLDQSLLDYLEMALVHDSETVRFEAAKALVWLVMSSRKFDESSLSIDPALTVLNALSSSHKDVVRFAAIRVIYSISQKRPHLLSAHCDSIIEPLVSDSCKAVAVLALVCLLKASADHDIDKRLRQIATLTADASEMHRSEIVQGVHQMCMKHPNKAPAVIDYLAKSLRDEGGKQSKSQTVTVMCHMAREGDEKLHQSVLGHLCEFIEDCEYHNVCCDILAFFAVEVPKSQSPGGYLRYIYNRVTLENANVRAAAVDSLTRIALAVPKVKEDVLQILRSNLLIDSEDELREQVNLSVRRICGEKETVHSDDESTIADFDDLLDVSDVSLPFSVNALTDSLAHHLEDGHASVMFPLHSVPTVEAYESLREAEIQRRAAATQLEEQPEKVTRSVDTYAAVQNLAKDLDIQLGELHHVTMPAPLTEQEAEYTVEIVKHLWSNTKFVSFELSVANTVKDQTLANVEVALSLNKGCAYSVRKQTSIDSLPYGDREAKCIYVLLERQVDEEYLGCSLVSRLNFTVCEGSHTYKDQYMMEPVKISHADFFCPLKSMHGRTMPGSQFADVWASLADFTDVVKLSYGHALRGGAEAALDKISGALSLTRVDTPNQGLHLVGEAVGSDKIVAIHVICVYTQAHGTLAKVRHPIAYTLSFLSMQVEVRCENDHISDVIKNIVRSL